MSAFMVCDGHIDTLLTFAILKRMSYWNPAACSGRGDRVYITRENATEIGAILLDENARSINARYGDTSPDFADESRPASQEYRYRPFKPDAPAVVILKACACYDYQACETDDYKGTLAAQIINEIRATAISSLPGYDGAEGWEIRDTRPAAPVLVAKPPRKRRA